MFTGKVRKGRSQFMSPGELWRLLNVSTSGGCILGAPGDTVVGDIMAPREL